MKQLHAKTPEAWREWLSQHYDSEDEVWLVFFKTGEPTVSYEAAVEEALCYGWIDSIIKKIDEAKDARKFFICEYSWPKNTVVRVKNSLANFHQPVPGTAPRIFARIL